MAERCRTSAVLWARAALLAAVLVCGAAGCQYPAAIHTYDYVTNYERMSGSYDPVLSLVYVPEPVALKNCRSAVIGPIGVGQAWVDAPEEAASYATFFRIVLRNRLARLGKFESVSLESQADGSVPAGTGPTLMIEGKITKFSMGSGFWRYASHFLLFVQWGATDIQIEGRITDARTGRLLVEFADRRRHMCNTPFGPNPRTTDNLYAMRVTVTETATCLARFIAEGWDNLPKVGTEAPPEKAAADVSDSEEAR